MIDAKSRLEILKGDHQASHRNVTEDDVVFDYKIHDGYSKTRNAIKLLSVLGFDSNIVNGAKNMAASFEKNGLWDIYG